MRGDTAEDQALKTIFDRELGTINASMSEAIFVTEVQLKCTSSYIRLQEVRASPRLACPTPAMLTLEIVARRKLGRRLSSQCI